MIVTRSFLYKMILVLVTIFLFFVDYNNCSYQLICIFTLTDLFLCGIILWKQGCVTLDNPIFWFWSITVLFSLGQNIAYLFITDTSLVSSTLLVGYKYSISDMCRGSIFTIQALNMMTLGLLWPLKQELNDFPEVDLEYKKNERTTALAAYYFGTVVLIMAAIPQILYVRAELLQFFSAGYGLNASEQLSGLVLRLHYLFVPALLSKYVGKVFLNKKTYLETAIILIQVLLFLAMGDRGTGLGLLVTYIWLRASTDKSFKIRKYIIPITLVVLAIPIVKYYRIAYTSNQGGALSSAINYVISNNPIIDILLETGGTQNIIIMTMARTATTGLAYGLAYLDFFIKMIPSFFGVEQNYGTLAKWVIGTTGYQTQGYSIWGEAYLNFGQMGIPFMFLIGLAFRLLLNNNGKSRVLSLLRVGISLSFFCDIARRSISEFGYNFLYDIVIPVVVIYLISDFLRKRAEKDE